MTRWVAAVAALLLGCQQGSNLDECRCGTTETPSTLSCDSKNLCQGNFEVVGHSDIGARGMNSALAIAGNYAYIGSRTDGVTHEHAGISIVDISDPAAPKVVGEIGPPEEAVLGLSSREMRAVPDLKQLYVLNFGCSPMIHDCSRDLSQFPTTGGSAETDNLKVFDLTDPVHPTLLGTYDFGNHPDSVPNTPPHEFFLWRDPNKPNRVIVYVTRYFGPPTLEVVDFTDPRNPTRIAAWDGVQDAGLSPSRPRDETIHSLTLSDDGKIAYVAHYGAGFFMLDTTTVADAAATSRHLDLITLPGAWLDYSPPYFPGTHSAAKVPGRDLVVLTDEIYPFDSGGMGCPWGWGWMVDISDPRAPGFFTTTDHDTGKVTIRGQMRLPFNEKDRCPANAEQDRISYSAHNPTLTPNLVIASWYGGGTQVMDITDPIHPVQVGAFYPDPIPNVVTEDPGLIGTTTETWSFPIIKNGLIYVVDIRNGLYVLRYNGPHADEVSSQSFLEGNSNIR